MALSKTGRFLSKAEILGVGVFSPLPIQSWRQILNLFWFGALRGFEATSSVCRICKANPLSQIPCHEFLFCRHCLRAAFHRGGASRSRLVRPFCLCLFWGFSPFFCFSGISWFFGDFPSGPPLSRPVRGTYEGHSRKGPQDSQDLSRKGEPPPQFGTPPPPVYLLSNCWGVKCTFVKMAPFFLRYFEFEIESHQKTCHRSSSGMATLTKFLRCRPMWRVACNAPLRRESRPCPSFPCFVFWFAWLFLSKDLFCCFLCLFQVVGSAGAENVMYVYIASARLCTLHLFSSLYVNDQTAWIATIVWPSTQLSKRKKGVC